MRILSDVSYIPELRKSLIFLGTLLENGFFYRYDGDTDIMKVDKVELTMMRSRRTACNINKLFGNTIIGDVS